MAGEVVMPRLSDSMEEGTILKWLKQVGDEVAVGEELVEIETDKANMAYEADVAGTLTEILAGDDETLAVGAVIARIGTPGEGPSGQLAAPAGAGDRPPLAAANASSAVTPSAPPAAAEAPVSGAEGSRRVKASPLARRIAQEQGMDLSALSGSGPGGRIGKRDVEVACASGGNGTVPAAAPVVKAAAETAKGEVRVEELSKLQAVVARRMSESKATAPHFYLGATVDMSAAVAARGRIKAAAAEGEVVPSFNDLVVKACGLALRELPRANGSYRDGRFELYSRVNVGVAVAADDALVVPTVFDADEKGLRRIATETRQLAQRARSGEITPPELSGGTFTVSNLGMFGISGFSAIVNPPQAGILAVGAIEPRPVVRAGVIVAADLMNVTLACDHRILDGAAGAAFLARVKALLEEPLALAL